MMKRLAGDQRGAIMLMGLAAAFVLIGALWFLMGIADTLVWRDKMQEAVDSAAFSSATVHARGMNFIAAMNLIMLAVVTIHVAIGLIADLLTIVGGICLIPPALAICGPSAPTILQGAKKVRNAQEKYDAFMWPTLTVLNAAQTATAVGAPHLGSLAGVETGKSYSVDTLALGASSFPLGFPSPPAKEGSANPDFPEKNIRLGLPVAFEPMNQMCKRPLSWIIDWAKTKMLDAPVVQQVLDALPIKGFVKKAIDEVVGSMNRYIGDGLAYLECDDGKSKTKIGGFLGKVKDAVQAIVPFGAPSDARWGKGGGKAMWGSASNGSQWMQVWAWTNGASKVDDEERKVGVARNKFGDIGTTSVRGHYVAQSEFYYDCGGPHAWDSLQCNGSGNLDSHFAVYNMKWKARLRRFRAPSFQQFVFETAANTADAFGWIDPVVAKIPGAKNPLGEYTVVHGLAKSYLGDAQGWASKMLASKPGEEILH
jgi:hypothetical protein